MRALYGKGRQAFGAGQINWTTDTVKAVLLNTALYTVSIDSDEFLSDIPDAAREETATLANKTNVLGVMDADDTVFAGTSGAEVSAVAMYKDTGVAATSPLIAYFDDASNLPVSLGGQITIVWSNNSSKIFKL